MVAFVEIGAMKRNSYTSHYYNHSLDLEWMISSLLKPNFRSSELVYDPVGFI